LLNFSLDLQKTAENSTISVLKLWAAKIRALWSLLAFKGAILNVQLFFFFFKYFIYIFFNVDIIVKNVFFYLQNILHFHYYIAGSIINRTMIIILLYITRPTLKRILTSQKLNHKLYVIRK